MSNIGEFAREARALSRNPLGIIALFIVLIYGFACLFAAAGQQQSIYERLPIIYFIVIFPFVVLGVFAWLVSCHPNKLYAPSDFKDEANYIAVAVALGAAGAAGAQQKPGNELTNKQALKAAVQAVGSTPWRRLTEHARRPCVLWVDDRPENNTYLRTAFEAAGVEIQIALSTDQALNLIKEAEFSAIISDMGRKEGPREGYVLLHEMRALRIETPFFIYAGSNSQEHKDEAARAGAQGSTNNATELFQSVMNALNESKPDWSPSMKFGRHPNRHS